MGLQRELRFERYLHAVGGAAVPRRRWVYLILNLHLNILDLQTEYYETTQVGYFFLQFGRSPESRVLTT